MTYQWDRYHEDDSVKHKVADSEVVVLGQNSATMSFELMRRSPERVELRSANEDEAEEKTDAPNTANQNEKPYEEVEKLCHPRAEYALVKE